jgi:hypothetical protein
MERKSNTASVVTMLVEVTEAACGCKRWQLIGRVVTMPDEVTAAAGSKGLQTEAVYGWQ